MLKTALAIRHIGFEDLGFLAPTLARNGYAMEYHEAGGDGLAAAETADLLIVLGGPMGVYEQDRHPYLGEEIALVRRRIAAGRPTIGICLGAQIIASALGGAVYPGPVKEIGFAPIVLTEAGAQSPLGAIAADQPVLHWHGDTFDLPDGATLLASTPATPHQAFALGAHVLALQFHLEAGADIDSWLTGHAAELAAARIDTVALRDDAARNAPILAELSDRVLQAWLSGLPA